MAGQRELEQSREQEAEEAASDSTFIERCGCRQRDLPLRPVKPGRRADEPYAPDLVAKIQSTATRQNA
jgi:hypothetical protein